MEKNSIISIQSHLYRILDLTRGKIPESYTASALILFIIIRRMESLYEPYRGKVLSTYNKDKDHLDDYTLDKKIRNVLDGELNFYILTPNTMRNFLAHGFFQGVAGFEHYIRCFDHDTAEHLLRYGAIDYVNRLLFAKVLAPIIGEICSIPFDSSMTIAEFEGLISKLLRVSSSDNRNIVTYSSNELSKVMASLLFAEQKLNKNASIYDPVCGSGNLLRVVRSHINQPTSIYGQEITERMSSLNNLMAKVALNDDCCFVSGDVLEEDMFPNKQFEYVVADLPLRQKIQKKLSFDENKNSPGVTINYEATPLFINHIVSKMSSKGRAVFTCLPSFFIDNHPYNDSLRSWMVKSDIIESIISLPAGFVYGSGLKICLCVLNKNKSKRRKGTIQIINAESLSPRQKNRGIVFTDETLNKLLSIYNSFEENKYSHKALLDELYQHEVEVKQPLRNNDGSLNLVDGTRVADNQKTVVVTIPNNVRDTEDYIYHNVLRHLDKDSWIDYASVQKKCKIDIYAPFEKVDDIRSADDVRKDVLNLSYNISSLFTGLFEDRKESKAVYSPEDFQPMQTIFGSVARAIRSRTSLEKSTSKSRYPVLSPNYLRGYTTEPEEYVETATNDQLVEDGDILIIMDGDSAGEVFRGKQGCMTRTMVKVVLETSALDKDYFYYLLKAKEPELRLMAKGNIIKHLSVSDLRSLLMVIPSITCQMTTVRSLNPKIETIDKLLPILGGESHALLVEYRQALIKDVISVVTPVMY